RALVEHHKKLIEKKKYMERIIEVVEKTIAHNKGEIRMTDKEKFESFKKEKMNENEKLYGEEARSKYGDKAVDESKNKFKHLTEEQFNEMNEIEKKLIEDLVKVTNSKDLDSEEAKSVFENHKKWLSFNMKYNGEVHKGIAQMYVLDERFASYYNDKAGLEVVETLKDIILKYA
ncbi:MAG: TipAS antibiotic-recognition domain-containing protein, partial [Sarcina sp.]